MKPLARPGPTSWVTTGFDVSGGRWRVELFKICFLQFECQISHMKILHIQPIQPRYQKRIPNLEKVIRDLEHVWFFNSNTIFCIWIQKMVGSGWKFFVWFLYSVFAFKYFYCTIDTQFGQNENNFYLFSLEFGYCSKDQWQFWKYHQLHVTANSKKNIST